MIFGSVLSDFEEINLETEDGKEFKMKNNLISRLGFKLIGIPHIEMRLRARKIFSFLPKANFFKVLDAGCGYGILSLTLKKKGFDVYAIDNNKERVSLLKNKLNVQQADILKLPFKDDFFEIIIVSDVLEHIKDDKKAFKELARVLKKGGILIVTVPTKTLKNTRSYKKWHHERPGYSWIDFHKFALDNDLEIRGIQPYSGDVTEKMFKINERLYKHKILLGFLFYPLYFLSVFDPHYNRNGIAVKFKKIGG